MNAVIDGVISRVSGFMTLLPIADFGGSNYYIDHYPLTFSQDRIIKQLVGGYEFEHSMGLDYFNIEYIGINSDYSSQPHYVFRCYRG